MVSESWFGTRLTLVFTDWWRLFQGFLLTSTQQMVDRLVLQTQDSITALSQLPAEDVQLIEETKGLIADAENVKQVQDPQIFLYYLLIEIKLISVSTVL